jgi:excisionase family DNA binding protein
VERLAYSVLEFAALLGISDDKVLRACQRGRIRNVTLGKRRLIPASYLAELHAEAVARLRDQAAAAVLATTPEADTPTR